MRRLALLLVILLLAVACSGGGESASGGGGSASEPATVPSSTQSTGPEVASGPSVDSGGQSTPEILDFQSQTVSGDAFQGGDFAGKDLMLWFWAPW